MGCIEAQRAPATLSAVLGSCIGLTLWHPRLRAAAMGHIVLSNSAGRKATPGKFADTALMHMIELLGEMGINASGLQAKVVGGASMFGGGGPLQTGADNEESVLAQLAAANIKVVARHLGGKKGRRVNFDCETGVLKVEIVGQPPELI